MTPVQSISSQRTTVADCMHAINVNMTQPKPIPRGSTILVLGRCNGFIVPADWIRRTPIEILLVGDHISQRGDESSITSPFYSVDCWHVSVTFISFVAHTGRRVF